MASGPARPAGPSADASLAPMAASVGGASERRRSMPRWAQRTMLTAPDEGDDDTGRAAACPDAPGSVFEPKTEMSRHSGRCIPQLALQ